ncbi:MAG: hypothetical protein ACPG7F_00090 [Aggregatilineales bacterium]
MNIGQMWLNAMSPDTSDSPVLQSGYGWTIDAELNDGTKPLYDVQHDTKTLTVNLHSGQMDAWHSPARFTWMIAGKQSGKTVLGPLFLFRWLNTFGAGDYLAVTATFDLFNLKVLPIIKDLFEHDLGIGRYHAGPQILEICNPYTGEFGATASHEHEKMWARIILRSAESSRGLQSATGLAAWMDEPGLYKASVYKDIRGRLSLARGPVFASTTPYLENDWMEEQVYTPWLEGKLPDTDMIQFSSKMSPFFPDEEYESLKVSMPKHEFQIDFEAEFGGQPPGAIYEDFVNEYRENGGHKVKRFVIPQTWARYVGVDPGVIHPAKLWLAHDPGEDIYYLYREQFGQDNSPDVAQPVGDTDQRMTSKEHASADVVLARELNERVIRWAIGAKSEKYWRADYKAAGARGVTEPDTADVWEGIDRVALLIRQHRLFIFDDCSGILRDIKKYSRVIRDGKIINKIKDKETFHHADALRYLAVMLVKPKHVKFEIGVSHYA